MDNKTIINIELYNVLMDLKYIIDEGKDPESSLPLKSMLDLLKTKLSTLNNTQDVLVLISSPVEYIDGATIRDKVLPIVRKHIVQLNVKYKFVFHISMKYYFDHDDVEFLNYGLFLTYRYWREYPETFNDSWNYQADKALFLLGKVDKINRIGLLSKFYDSNTIDRLDYTMNVHEDSLPKLRSILTNYADIDFYKFIDVCKSPSADIDLTFIGDQFVYGGYPVNPDLYRNTSMSIVSETFCGTWGDTIYDVGLYITEKTWRAIANKHPFVIAGNPRTLATLKHYGIRTFEQYLPYPFYDDIPRVEERLDIVRKNVIGLLDNMSKYHGSIYCDIEHNFKVFTELGEQHHNEINKLLEGSELNSFSVYKHYCP